MTNRMHEGTQLAGPSLIAILWAKEIISWINFCVWRFVLLMALKVLKWNVYTFPCYLSLQRLLIYQGLACVKRASGASLALSMQTACLLDTLISSESDERWELELLLSSVNKEIEMHCGGSIGISKTFSGVMWGHNSPGLLLLLMGGQVWMPSWGVWIRYDKPQEASEACLVRKWHDENGDGGLHSAAGGQLF